LVGLHNDYNRRAFPLLATEWLGKSNELFLMGLLANSSTVCPPNVEDLRYGKR
jgi:hypothetical protein